MTSSPLLPAHRRDLIVTNARRWTMGEASAAVALPFDFEQMDCRLVASAVPRSTIETAPMVVELVHRVAPWATVYVAPRVLCPLNETDDRHGLHYPTGGTDFQSYSGCCLGRLGIVALALTSPQLMLSVAAHEAWHAVEARLSDDWKGVLDADLGAAPYGAAHPYWGNPEERRCRAFQAWCGRFLEGLPPFVGTSSLDEIFGMAWSGKLGHDLSTTTERRIIA